MLGEVCSSIVVSYSVDRIGGLLVSSLFYKASSVICESDILRMNETKFCKVNLISVLIEN